MRHLLGETTVNDDEMRGCWRASEVIRAYETSYSGLELLGGIDDEWRHAMAVWAKSSDQGIRDEWGWRAKMYLAAYRRLAEKEALLVA